METIIFFKQLGSTSLALALLLGAGYWINVAVKKFFPNWKFWFKYKLFKRKINMEVADFLEKYLEKEVDADEMVKKILLSGHATHKEAEELKYIYKELQGGIRK